MSKYKINRAVQIESSKIHPNPWNPNRTSQRQDEAIAESLQLYGQISELLVRPHPEVEGFYEVIDGEHRLQNLPDRVFVNIIENLSDADAKKLTIIMNETRGEADRVSLFKLLEDIGNNLGDELGLGLPYTAKELEEMISLANVDWEIPIDTEDPDLEDIDNSENFDENKDLISLFIKLPASVKEKLDGCKDLVEQQKELSPDLAVAWGQVLETILDDYLGTI